MNIFGKNYVDMEWDVYILMGCQFSSAGTHDCRKAFSLLFLGEIENVFLCTSEERNCLAYSHFKTVS